MSSCALDISDLSIKYGELLATPIGLRLGRFGQEIIPAGIIVSGKIEKELELIEILKKLSSREHLHFVRISLPEEQMYLFTLSIPNINKEDIRNIILLQLEEHIPLQALDTVFDYQIISIDDKSIFVEVLAISITIIESYTSILKKSGLVPLSFELEAQAIARAVIPQGDQSSVMIVDFGNTRTGVSIVYNGRVLFTTTLDIGGNNITDVIAKNFSLSFEKAEKLKRSNGLRDNQDIKNIFPVILNTLSVLRDELNKQYLYWKTHNDESIKNKDIDYIILCGGDANLLGLSEYLESSMMLKVENANAWVNISDMKISIPEMSFEESFGYATILGLALADYTDPKSMINVLPTKEKHAIKKEYLMRFGSILFSTFSVIGIIAILLIFPSYFLSTSELTLAENKLEAFNITNPEIMTRDFDATILDINNKLVLLSNKDSSILVSDTILNNFILNRPKGITLSSILYSEKKVAKGNFINKTFDINGSAVDRATLRTYKSILANSPDIDQVDLPISDFLDRSNINFTMSIILK